MVLLVSLDIQLAALYAVGLAVVLMVSERAIRFRTVGGALFGMALMFIGLGLIKGSAVSLVGESGFAEFLRLTEDSLWLSFLGAAALSFLVQSAPAVMVFAIGMGAVGVLTVDQVFISIFGSFFGSALIMLVLSRSLTGASRRIAMFGVFNNIVSIAVFVPLFYLELWSGVPMMKALVLATPLGQPMSVLSMISDIFLAIPLMLALSLIVRFHIRLWPATTEESMSRAAYIHNRGYTDIASALELIALEQRRVLSAFSSYLDAVRQGDGVDSLRNAIRPVIREIDEFLTEVRVRHPGHAIEDVNSVLAQQRLIVWLEEQLAELCYELSRLPNDEATAQLRNVLIDGIDTVTLVIIDGLTSPDPEDWSMVMQLTGDRSELLRRIRTAYMSVETPPSDAVQANILKATNTAAEIFFLFSRLTREMKDSPALAPASPESPPLP